MSGQITTNDSYADKLTKLLPAEGIAALTTIKTMLSGNSDNMPFLLGSAACVGLFVLAWAIKARKVSDPLQIGFILIAYALWAINILWDMLTGRFEWAAEAPTALPAILCILFALFIPLLAPAATPIDKQARA